MGAVEVFENKVIGAPEGAGASHGGKHWGELWGGRGGDGLKKLMQKIILGQSLSAEKASSVDFIVNSGYGLYERMFYFL